MNKYKNYFKKQYKNSLSGETIETYKKWFYAQWNFFLRKIKLMRNARVLEIGSGYGTVYSFLKVKINEKNYCGLELDYDMCKFTNNYFKTDVFKNISIENFKSRDKYDFIFAFEVLEHVDNPRKTIEKVRSLLKEKGTFIGTSPYPYPKNVYADDTHQYVLHPSNWEKLFKDSGFKSIETYPMSFVPFLWRLNKRINIRIPFYVPLPYFISTTLIIAKK